MSLYPQTTSFTDYSYRLNIRKESLPSSYFYEKVLVTSPAILELIFFPVSLGNQKPSCKVFPPGNLTLCNWACGRRSLQSKRRKRRSWSKYSGRMQWSWRRISIRRRYIRTGLENLIEVRERKKTSVVLYSRNQTKSVNCLKKQNLKTGTYERIIFVGP